MNDEQLFRYIALKGDEYNEFDNDELKKNVIGNQWQPQASGYDVAPGAPMPVDCSAYPGCVPAQQQAYDPCGPNGGQGYGAPSPYYQQGPVAQDPTLTAAAYCQEQYSQPSTSYQCYEMSSQQPGLPPGAKIVAEYFLGYLDDQPPSVQQQYQSAQQASYAAAAAAGYPMAPQSSSESSKEECDVEVRCSPSPLRRSSTNLLILIDCSFRTEFIQYVRFL